MSIAENLLYRPNEQYPYITAFDYSYVGYREYSWRVEAWAEASLDNGPAGMRLYKRDPNNPAYFRLIGENASDGIYRRSKSFVGPNA